MEDPPSGGDPAEEALDSALGDGQDGLDGASPPTLASTPRRPTRYWAITLAVAAAVFVVVGVLYFGLLGPQYAPLAPKTPPNSSPPSSTFSQAFPIANSTVQQQAGGPWWLVASTGIALPPGLNAHFEYPAMSGPCGHAAAPPVPASAPNDSASGRAPFWDFTFEAGGSNSTIEAVVVGGAAQILGVSPPTSHCLGTGRVGTLAPAPRIEDSPNVARSLTNLTSFLATFPNTGVIFALDDVGGELGKVSGTAVWTVQGSPCFTVATASPTAGDPVYLGGVNGTTRQVIVDDPAPGYGSCEVPGTLAPALSLDVPQLTYASGGFAY